MPHKNTTARIFAPDEYLIFHGPDCIGAVKKNGAAFEASVHGVLVGVDANLDKATAMLETLSGKVMKDG